MIWPWSEIRRLRDQLAWYKERENYHLFLIQLRENIAIKAMRDQAAAHKGIRRLVEKLKKQQKGTPCKAADLHKGRIAEEEAP